ncbi:hypothetical protein PTT_08442 [Pyrenophora teres f. teres 0-1]|uniref:Uncharacterized protein n=1 Tax=Pyrenophora teres f. teres (strain 0-1) TaxID=861557 RepID=E3RJT1_PYRTT|nr:hypothetical protein PTT_08442 [Pyrenophora teres f. teres 0-1]
MSADLFAEFGADPPPNQQQHVTASAKPSAAAASDFSFFNDINTSTPAAPLQQPRSTIDFQGLSSTPIQDLTSDDNDEWGDFEGGSSSQPVDQTWQHAPVIKAKKSADPSVLFDAEDDFDDEFGDFEGEQEVNEAQAAQNGPSAPSSTLADLLGDMSMSQPKSPTTSGKNEFDTRGPLKSTGNTKKSLKSGLGAASKPNQPPITAAVAQDDGGWDEFDDWEASIPSKPSTKPEAIQTAKANETITRPNPILSPIPSDPQPGELPPTNVPPPGVLLSLFPPLFTEAQEKLFKPMAAQPLPMRNKLMAEPATIVYLQGYLVLANVAAHIIAGRKLRWKRDQHLSQGMRIGPASSRATSGMKLTGVDKGENLKEEREVSDVVRTWKEQVGRLRHVVSGVNQIKAGTLDRGPDLQDMMPVRTLKQSEGGMPARQPCMLCGLKREERVTAADMATDDSFGEWWIDQVNMHRGCRNFWNEHKDSLRQR